MFFELILLIFFFLQTGWELWGVWEAKKSNRTSNLSRFFTHSLLLGLAFVLLGEFFYGKIVLPMAFPAIKNWAYLAFLLVALLLTGWEFCGIALAFFNRKTENRYRLLNHLIMLFILFAIFVKNLLYT